MVLTLHQMIIISIQIKKIKLKSTTKNRLLENKRNIILTLFIKQLIQKEVQILQEIIYQLLII